MLRNLQTKPSIELALSLVSLICAVVALLVSIRSCSVSQRSLEMAQVEFREARRILLHGKLADEQVPKVELSPSVSEARLQLLTIRLPPEIAKNKMISFPGNMNLTPWLSNIRNYFLAFKPLRDGQIYSTYVPVFVRLAYLLKSEERSENHVYALLFVNFRRGGDSIDRLTFGPLTFLKRISEEKDESGLLSQDLREAPVLVLEACDEPQAKKSCVGKGSRSK